MKKTKFIVLALVVVIAAMGASYAAWTDRIDINNDLKTGHLDVYFDKTGATFSGVSAEVGTKVSYARDEEDNGQNNLDIANVTLSNLYPGAQANVTLKIVNNSTIPVSMEAIRSNQSWTTGVEFAQIGASLRFFDENGTALNEFTTNQGGVSSYANPWAPNQLSEAEIPVGGYATLTFMYTAKDVDEDATYTFDVWTNFIQFNQ